jgi:spore coat polysaccharide biosynthesis protein SpsF
MRIIAVIQARFSSRRLPGKILLEIRGRPTLEYLLEGLDHCERRDGLVVATSTDPSDDRTAAFARNSGTACYRGGLENVALRILSAGEQHLADAVVRVNGDSPLLDPALVDQAIELFRQAPVDVVTNVHPRTFPKGQSVEVIAVPALRRAVAAMSASEDREHVTPYLYSHPQEFSVRSFMADPPRPDVQLSVDDAADFSRCARILQMLDGAPWSAGWRACVAAYDQAVAATSAT